MGMTYIGNRNRIPPYKNLIGGELTFTQNILSMFRGNFVGYWPMNEQAGDDYVTFNNISTYIDCGSGATIDNLADAELTIEAWIRTTATTVDRDIIVNKGYAGSGWFLSIEPSGKPLFFVDCVTTDALCSWIGAVVNDGDWHHIAGYFNDAGDRKCYLSVDGVWQTGSAGVGAIVADAAANLMIGRRSNSATYFYGGDISWVRASNNDRHNHGVNFTPPPRTFPPVVGDANTPILIRMDEGYGTQASDSSGNGNHGTITAGQWPTAYPAVRDISPQGNNAVYQSPALGNYPFIDEVGGYAPFFDRAYGRVNLYSTSLETNFINFASQQGTMVIFSRVRDVSVWTDGVVRYLMQIYGSLNDWIWIRKNVANNNLELTYRVGGVSETVAIAPHNPTTWQMYGITWDKPANEMKAYLNGVQTGTTQAIANTWTAASLLNTATNIGAYLVNTSVTDGWLAHGFVLVGAATPNEMLKVAQYAGLA